MPSKYGFKTRREIERAIEEENRRRERRAAQARKLRFVEDVLRDWTKTRHGLSTLDFFWIGQQPYVIRLPEARELSWRVCWRKTAAGEDSAIVRVYPVFDDRERIVALQVSTGGYASYSGVKASVSVASLVEALKKF